MNAHADTPQVRTLLLTDLVDSTSLVERIGDTAAAELFRAHDRIVLALQQRWRGRLIDRSDGLLLIFERPIDGLGFALDYVRGLRDLGRELKQPLQARAGLHVGEVLVWENSLDAVRLGAKSLEVEGLAKPLTGRLMALARPGQILLSATAEPLAHRAARELGERGELLVWKSYGRWRFKGLPEAQEIHEVGEPGLAPLRMPAHTPKAWRDLPLWRRPAALAVETLLLAGIAVSGWFIAQPKPAIAFAERDWVVVGDLRNLTGEQRFDDSLEQAFRLSLQQSNYVNVLSDLKVRETLRHMQQEPGARVDRALGSEIAQRDGARAVLLPTVAEVGGRLRISAEVIDPRTQITVYAVSADGKGIESALASIDDVTDQLREKLGEAMQNVQRSSVPLPNVATPSLDALKVFAVARKVYAETQDREQALGLYRRALQLDPEFALAHADMGGVYSSLGEVGLANEARRRALAIPQRLSPQERARIELQLQMYGPPGPYFRSAVEYTTLYPDEFGMLRRLGDLRWHHLNDFRAAERAYQQVLKPQNAQIGIVHYSLGIALLGQDRIEAAAAEFRRARAAGFSGAGEMYARAFDARGQHAESDKAYLSSTAGRGGWKGDAGVVTAIDRGQWTQAADLAAQWKREADAGNDPVDQLRAQSAVASVAMLAAAPGRKAKLLALRDAARERASEADAIYPPLATELRLLVGLLAALDGDAALVAEALDATRDSATVRDYPTLAQLRQVVLAEQERLTGKPEAAVLRLRNLARQDTALVAVQWALKQAAAAAGDARTARAQSDWLATRRGRVFAENTTGDVLRYFNAGVSAEAIRARKPATPTVQ